MPQRTWFQGSPEAEASVGAQILGQWSGGPSGAESGHTAWELESGHIALEAALA